MTPDICHYCIHCGIISIVIVQIYSCWKHAITVCFFFRNPWTKCGILEGTDYNSSAYSAIQETSNLIYYSYTLNIWKIITFTCVITNHNVFATEIRNNMMSVQKVLNSKSKSDYQKISKEVFFSKLLNLATKAPFTNFNSQLWQAIIGVHPCCITCT